MDYPFQLLLLAALVAALSEYVDSTLGMGYGTMLSPLLLLMGFDPLALVPAILGSECITGLVAARLHHSFGNVSFQRGSPHTKTALLLAVCGVVGVIAAVSLATHVPRRFVSIYIGVMVLATGLVILATRRMHLRLSWTGITAVGLVGAFNKGIGGGGYGPLMTGGQILSGVDAKAAIGVTSFAEGVVSLVGLLCYFFFAMGDLDWRLALALPVGGLVATPLAALTLRRIRARHVRLIAGLVVSLLGLLVIVRLAVA